MRCVIYARLSKRTEVNAPNIDSQLDRCREYALKHGWTVVAERVDYGASAYNRDDMEDRPGFADVLADIRSRSVDAVLAWRPDRLWRDPIECAVVMRLCVKHGVQSVATVTEGVRDPNNPGDEMIATIVAAVGRYESAAKSARLRAKKRQQAEKGMHVGGQVAYGYTDHTRRTIDEHEAAAIRFMADRIRSGASLTSVVVALNEAGYRRKKGVPWTATTVSRLIKRPYLAGLNVHHGQIVGPGDWPPILDVDTWTRTVDALAQFHRRPNRATSRTYLLTTGLAVCGLCGAPLHAQPRADKRRTYRCIREAVGGKGCGKLRILAEPFEKDVTARLFDAVTTGELVDVEPPPATVTLEHVNAAEAKLTALARDHYALGVISRDEYLAAREPLAGEAERLRLALAAQAPPSRPSLWDVLTLWSAASVGERRELLRPIVDRVEVGPARRGFNRYDPSRVSVMWAAPYRS